MVRVLTELGGEDGEDRISQLPDEIIHSILHRLRYPEEAARTSLLSKRWLQLWRCYPFFEFRLLESNESQFRSFVASTSRKLLSLPPSDSDHRSSSSCCAAVADFSISLSRDDFQMEDLDELVVLITNANNGLSPEKFVLEIGGSRWPPCYSLPVLNWSRTRILILRGCDLSTTTAYGVHDNHNHNNALCLGSLELFDLCDVSLSEELLRNFLANAPCLLSLRLSRVYGNDRLEIVYSAGLQVLHLGDIYRVGRPRLVFGDEDCSEKMRRLRISSPKLKSLSMGSGLEELHIDAPNLVSLSWSIFPGDPLTNVNVVQLASNCQSTIRVFSLATFPPQTLRPTVNSHHVRPRELGYQVLLSLIRTGAIVLEPS